MTSAYTFSEGEDGRTVYTKYSGADANVLNGIRMHVGLTPVSSDDYIVDPGIPAVHKKAMNEWTKYLSTGSVLNYTGLMNAEDSDAYNKTAAALKDYQEPKVPLLIKGELSWEDYVTGLKEIKPESAAEQLQKYIP